MSMAEMGKITVTFEIYGRSGAQSTVTVELDDTGRGVFLQSIEIAGSEGPTVDDVVARLRRIGIDCRAPRMNDEDRAAMMRLLDGPPDLR